MYSQRFLCAVIKFQVDNDAIQRLFAITPFQYRNDNKVYIIFYRLLQGLNPMSLPIQSASAQ